MANLKRKPFDGKTWKTCRKVNCDNLLKETSKLWCTEHAAHLYAKKAAQRTRKADREWRERWVKNYGNTYGRQK
jgi:hypothetical protein